MNTERRLRKRWPIVAAVAAVTTGIALAELQTNQSLLAEIRSGMMSIKPIIATVKKGEKLDVVGKEKGGWLKVKVGDKTGYVPESALKEQNDKLGLASADPRASATELAAAGKGLNDRAIQYASSKNLSTAGVEKMLEARRKVTEKDFNDFVAAGNLKAMAFGSSTAHSTALAMAAQTSSQGK